MSEFQPKFVGAVLPSDAIAIIENERASRIAAGKKTSRSDLIIEAVRKSFPQTETPVAG